jgi:2-iminoacetate synthase ThiH
MAGSEKGSAESVEELIAIAEGIGRRARQRTTNHKRSHPSGPKTEETTQSEREG